MASSKKTIQSTQNVTNSKALRTNAKSFEQFSYFLGGVDVTNQNLNQFTPYLRGVSRIFLHKPPLFMLDYDSEMTRRFKTYIETGYKTISGIGDVSVEFTTFEAGFNGQQYQVPQLARDETDTVTISVYELMGSPIREYIDTWVTGVRDPRSGIAHYHGMIERQYWDDAIGNSVRDAGSSEYSNTAQAAAVPRAYGEYNHTAEFIYTTYDPTGLYLEYACMFAHCFPKRVPKDHLNYESGNRSEAQLDLEFATTKYESPVINDIGIWYTQNSKILWNYLDFNPEQNGTDDGSRLGYGSIGSNDINVSTYHYGNYETEYQKRKAFVNNTGYETEFYGENDTD